MGRRLLIKNARLVNEGVERDGDLLVENGRILAPGGADWQAVVVPVCRQMPHATLAKLAALAEQGATVIFQQSLPEDVPGLGKLEQRRAEFQAAVQRLQGSPDRVRIGDLDPSLLRAGTDRDHCGRKQSFVGFSRFLNK